MYEAAKRVIDIVGGPAAAAAIAGVHVSQVHRWTYERSRGGTDGLIPAKHQATFLRWARENGVDLTPSHFFDALPEVGEVSGGAA